MNPLNWFPFVNEDKKENVLDASLVLPLTVGVGTFVVSVFLNYRSAIFGMGKETASSKASQVHATLNSLRDFTKRKPLKSSAKPKSTNNHAIELKIPTKSPSKIITEPLSTQVASSEAPHSSSSSASTSSPVCTTLSKDLPSTSTELEVGGSLGSVATKAPSEARKSKKTKRPPRPESTTELHSQLEEEPFKASEWVTVTAKKSKRSLTHPPTSASVTCPKQKIAGHPPVSTPIVTTTAATTTSNSVSSDPATSIVTAVSPQITAMTKSPPTSDQTDASANKEPTVAPSTPVNQPSAPSTDNTLTLSSLTSATDSAPEPDHEPKDTTVNITDLVDTMSPVSSSVEVQPKVVPEVVGPTLHLPAMHQLLARHLPAQLQAKELECQALRSEIIRLREEIRQSRAPQAAKQVPIVVDAETETETECTAPQPDEATVAEPTPTPVAVPNDSSHTSDSVLWQALRDEIARLTKEVTILRQRNANTETRLETTKTQLTTAKKKASRVSKSVRQQLDTELQRAEETEKSIQQLEAQLQEALQQNEIQRRKSEERDHSTMQQLERARYEYATLLSQKEACVADLDVMQRKSEELRVALSDAQSRLESLDCERASALAESQDKVAQLEAQLASNEHLTHEKQTAFSTLEDNVAELHAHVDRLTGQLAEREQELHLSRTQCVTLENALSEERFARQTSNIEYVQTKPDTVSQSVSVECCNHLDATAQTDSDAIAEFDCQQSGSHPVEPQPDPVDTSPSTASDDRLSDALAKVEHYKSTLDATEAMLSNLQTSVDEEEQRWREALLASKMECELLESKISKLEFSLSSAVEERDKLRAALDEEKQKTDDDSVDLQSGYCGPVSSVRSLTFNNLADTISLDENVPKSELLRNLNRLRHLVHIEHEALKKEQAKTAQLQSQLLASACGDSVRTESPHSDILFPNMGNCAQMPLSDNVSAAKISHPDAVPTATTSNGHRINSGDILVTKLQDPDICSDDADPMNVPNGVFHSHTEPNGTPNLEITK